MSANSAVKKKATNRSEMSKAAWTWKEIKRNKTAYVMIAPFVILFFIFTILPVGVSIVLSFTDFNMLQTPDFVFMDNYITLFLDDDIFITSVKNTFIFAAIVGPGSYLLSFICAWFINELSPKIRAIVTLIFYSPSISGGAYLMWNIVFSSDSYGYANALLIDFGFINMPIQWFQDADYVMPLCIVVALWTSLGTAFLSFIAGFQGVDHSLYEAGAVDGIKNRWQELWYVTLPTMKPQLMFGAVMAITQAFGFGAIVTSLAGFPSVDYAAHTIMHHLEDYGTTRWEVGYASAIATVLFLIMYGSNALVKKLLTKVGN